MPSLSKVRVELNEAGFRELAASPDFRDALLDIGTSAIARPAAARAPKRTGFGASSIHAEAVFEGGEWTVRVSWSKAAGYMRHHEFGTRHMDADPFLEPTVEGLL